MTTLNIHTYLLLAIALGLVLQTISNAGLALTILSILPAAGWLWFFCLYKRASPGKTTALPIALSAGTAYLLAPVFATAGDASGQFIAALAAGDQLTWFVLRAGVIEELAKLSAVIVVLRYVAPKAIRHPRDGMLMAAAAALGFATYENLFHGLHILQQGAAEATWLFLLGALVRVPLHPLYASIWGAALGLSAFAESARQRWLMLLMALSMAMFVHGLWDTLAQHTESPVAWLSLAACYAALWWTYLRRWRQVDTIQLSSARDDSLTG